MSDSLTKQPNESRLYDMDFTKLLGTETIASVDSVTQQKFDKATRTYAVTTDLDIGTASFSGALAQVRIADGLTTESYKVTFIVTDSVGNVLEGDGILVVVDL